MRNPWFLSGFFADILFKGLGCKRSRDAKIYVFDIYDFSQTTIERRKLGK